MNKKYFLLIPTLFLTVSVTGCSNYTVPTFAKSEGVSFVAYAGPTVRAFGNVPTNTDEHFAKVKEAGFTHVLALYEGCGPSNTESKEKNLKQRATKANHDAMIALECCAKVGLKYYVRDWNLYGMSRPTELSYSQGVNCYQEYQKAMDIIFDEDCEYIHHPNYAGSYLFDEPEYSEIDGMSEVARAYLEKMNQLGITGVEPYLNLLPAYAGYSALGPNGYTGYMQKYLNKIGNDVGYLSYDSYPFMNDTTGSYIKMTYLYGTLYAARACKESGVALRTYVQTKGDFTGLRDMTSTADFRFQVYNNLAFGSHYMTYYEYGAKTSAEEGNFGLLNLMDGSYNWTYEAVKTVNQEVHNFEDVLCAYEWDDIMLKNADELYENANFSNVADALEKHDKVAFKSVTADTLLTTFKHKENGSDAFMVMNYSDPYFKNNDKVKLSFPNAKGLLMYRLGQKMVVDLPFNGEYTCVLGPGEGRFIIPLY